MSELLTHIAQPVGIVALVIGTAFAIENGVKLIKFLEGEND